MESGEQGPYTVREAAEKCGVQIGTVRRWIRSGRVRTEQRRGRHGPEYRVYLSATLIDECANTVSESEQDSDDEGSDTEQDSGSTVLTLLEMVREKDTRIQALERERFELAGRLGYFQAQVEEARERIRMLEAPRETPKLERLKRWWELWK